MHYIDELLALYPGKDPFTRKFILSQALDHAADGHSAELIHVLDAEMRSDDAIVKRQARHALGDFLPAHTASAYGFVSRRAGIWTRHFGTAPAPVDVPSTAELLATPEARALTAGASAWLEAQLSELVAVMLHRGTPAERARASLVLGRLHTPATIEALVGQISGADGPSFQAGFALAEAGDEAAVAALVAAVAAHGRAQPDLYLLLRAVPCPAALACLEEHEEGSDAVGRSNIALALAPYAPERTRPLLERMLRRREGWVTAYVLDTLSVHGDPADLPLIRLAWELEPHEFIRIQAVRAAGTIRTEEARAFCREVIAGPPGRLQSVALEALAGQDTPMAELAPLAEPYLESEFVRTSVQAMLILARTDPGRVSAALDKLVLSPQALRRLEGAFIIGYLRGAGSLELLAGMAASDPSGAVRLQAIKSLGRFAPAEALPVLLPLLAHPKLAACAAGVIAGLEDPAGIVLPALAEAARGLKEAPQAAAALAALGAVAAAGGGPAPRVLVDALTRPEEEVVAGALEGLAYLGDQIPIGRVRPLLTARAPRVRARAAVAAFLAGYPEEAAALTALLAPGDEAGCIAAIDALLEIAQVTPFLARGSYSAAVARLRNPPRAPGAKPRPLSRASGALAIPAGNVPGATVRLKSESQRERLRARAAQEVPTPALSASANHHLASLIRNYASHAQAPDTEAAASGIGGAISGVFLPPAGPLPAGRGSSRVMRHPAALGTGALLRQLAVPLGSALVIAITIGLAVTWRMGAEEPTSAAAAEAASRERWSRLRVFFASGPCRGTVKGRAVEKLAVGAFLAVGDAVETGDAASLHLRDAHDTRVDLAAASAIRVLAPSPGAASAPQAAIALTGGAAEVGAAKAELSVQLGASTYRVRTGQAKLAAKAGGWSVEQRTGDAVVVGRSGSRQALVAGQSVQVEP